MSYQQIRSPFTLGTYQGLSGPAVFGDDLLQAKRSIMIALQHSSGYIHTLGLERGVAVQLFIVKFVVDHQTVCLPELVEFAASVLVFLHESLQFFAQFGVLFSDLPYGRLCSR